MSMDRGEEYRGFEIGADSQGLCDVCHQEREVAWFNGPGVVLPPGLHGTTGTVLAGLNRMTRVLEPREYGELHLQVCMSCLLVAIDLVRGG
jgi:hypothetical protein